MNNCKKIENFLLYAGKILIYLVPFTAVVVSKQLFFPFIAPKNFYFRIVVGLLLGVWLGLLILNRKKYTPKGNLLVLAVALWLIVMVLATIFGVNPYHSFWSNFERMEGLITYLHLAALFLAMAGLLKERKEWYLFFQISLAVGIYISGFALLENFEAIKTLSSGGRVFSTLGNAIYLAVYSLLNFFIAGFLFFEDRRLPFRVFYIVAFAINFLAFWYARSRGAFLGLAAGLFVFLLLYLFFSRQRRAYKIAATALLLVFVASPVALVVLKDVSFIADSPTLSRFSELSFKSQTVRSRFMIWNIGWQAFKQRPILGWGPGNFIVPYAKYYDPGLFGNEPWFDRAHNFVFDWLVSGGILGFLSYLGIFMSALFLIFRMLYRQTISFWLGGIIFAMLSAYIVQNFFVFDQIVSYFIFFSILAFIYFLSLQSEGGNVLENNPKSNNYNNSTYRITGVVGIGILVLIGVAYFNTKPIFAGAALIDALGAETQSAQDAIAGIDEALSYNTFADTEIRQHLAGVAIQLSRSSAPGNQAFALVLDKAIAEMEKQIKNWPQSVRDQIFLGRLYSIKAKRSAKGGEEAIKLAFLHYQKAKELAPNYLLIDMDLSEIYLLLGQYDNAVQVSEKVYGLTKETPGRGKSYMNLLVVYLYAGDIDSAIAHVERIKAEKPFSEYSAFLSEINMALKPLVNIKNTQKKIEFLELVSNMRPGNVNPLLLLAQIYADEGNVEKAEEAALLAYQRTRDPDHKAQIAAFLQSLGRPVEI